MLGPLLEVEISQKCTPLWREAHFEVKSVKTPQVRSAFGRCDVEKVRAVVVRSTFGTKKWQNTSGSDDFWKLRGRKSARRCGAKHILSQKVKTTTCSATFGRFDCHSASKKCTPWWHDAHLEVKCVKN